MQYIIKFFLRNCFDLFGFEKPGPKGQIKNNCFPEINWCKIRAKHRKSVTKKSEYETNSNFKNINVLPNSKFL